VFSKAYLKELKTVHTNSSRRNGFGGKVKSLGSFKRYMSLWQPQTVLDYGCGKGVMLAHFREIYPEVKFTGYDPAMHMFNERPAKQFECVFSCDVLEHVEPEYIDQVLQDIHTYASNFVWLRIDTMPARKKLSDGRNAHLIIQNQDWWLEKIHSFITGEIIYSELTSKNKLDVAIEKTWDI